MMLPDGERAHVDRSKIVDYLLCESHSDGRGKAAFFASYGFKPEEWKVLADALRDIGISNPVQQIVESPYGRRYTVDGSLRAPDGRAPMVRTVWIVEPGSGPRLVTAYPLQTS